MAIGESKRLALVVAGGLVVGLGLAAVYFLGIAPRQQRAEAVAQITAWEAQWTAAEHCLFGSRRRGTDLVEALALAPFDDTRPDDSECNRRIGKLSRPEGPAIALGDVEDAWTELEARAVALARRYGAFVSAPVRERAGLAAAAAELDTAHDRLRAAAGMPARVRALDGIAIRGLSPVRIGPEARLVELDYRRIGDGLVQLRVGAIDARYDVVARGVDQVTTRRLDAAAIRSYPSGTWGAVVTGDPGQPLTVYAGASDGDGVVGRGAVVATGDDAGVELVAALGDGRDRILIGGDAHRARVFRSRDAGATWAGSDLKGASRVHVHPDPIGAALDLFWQGPTSWRWTRFEAATAAALPEVRDLDIAPEKTCPSGADRWSIAGTGSAARVVRVGPGAGPGPGGDKIDIALPDARAVIACTAGAALVVAGDDLVRCGAGTCAPVLADVPASARGDAGADRGLAALDDTRALFATQRGDVVAIWGLGPTEQFVRIPDASTAFGLVVWAGRGHLLLWGDPGLTAAPLP